MFAVTTDKNHYPSSFWDNFHHMANAMNIISHYVFHVWNCSLSLEPLLKYAIVFLSSCDCPSHLECNRVPMSAPSESHLVWDYRCQEPESNKKWHGDSGNDCCVLQHHCYSLGLHVVFLILWFNKIIWRKCFVLNQNDILLHVILV